MLAQVLRLHAQFYIRPCSVIFLYMYIHAVRFCGYLYKLVTWVSCTHVYSFRFVCTWHKDYSRWEDIFSSKGTGIRERESSSSSKMMAAKAYVGEGMRAQIITVKNVWKLNWLMVHAFCGTEGNSHRLCHCDTRIACSHCSTTKFRVSHSCSDCSSDIDAAYPENGSCRIVWVVVLPVLADQDAFGSSSYQILCQLCA